MDLPGGLAPHHPEHGVLLLQLPEHPQGGVDVAALRQHHPVAEHRLQLRGPALRLRPQPLAGAGVGQTGDGADRPRRGLLHRSELLPGVEADLVHLLLPGGLALPAGEGVPDTEGPAGDLQEGQPPALAVPGDLIDPGGKGPGQVRRGGEASKAIQQRLHPLQPEGGAEVAGEHPPPGHQVPDRLVGEAPVSR